MSVELSTIDFAPAIIRSGGTLLCTIYVKAPDVTDTELTLTISDSTLVVDTFPSTLTLPAGAVGVVRQITTVLGSSGRATLTVSCTNPAQCTDPTSISETFKISTQAAAGAVVAKSIPISLTVTGPFQPTDGTELAVTTNDTVLVNMAISDPPDQDTPITIQLSGFTQALDGTITADNSIFPLDVTSNLPSVIEEGRTAVSFPVYIYPGSDPNLVYQVMVTANLGTNRASTIIQFQDVSILTP